MRPHLTPGDMLQIWTAVNRKPAVALTLNDDTSSSWVGANLASAAFPRLRVRSPIQTANETDKTVSFSILSRCYRAACQR